MKNPGGVTPRGSFSATQAEELQPSQAEKADNMTNLVCPVPQSNRAFLEGIFGARRCDDAHTTSFWGDPAKGRWGGCRVRDAKWLEEHSRNQYVAISTCWDNDRGQARRLKELWRAMYVLILDDVGVGLKVDPARARRMLPPPTFRIETSPGNEQWGYVLELPELDYGRATAAVQALVQAGLTDPGAEGIIRYFRMPFSHNMKKKYTDALGPAGAGVQLREWAGPRYMISEIIEDALGVKLPAPGEVVFTPGSNGRVLDPAEAAKDVVLAAMNDLGWVKDKTANDWGYDVVCPFTDEHTDEADNGCAYQPGPKGGWVCHHGHCSNGHVIPGTNPPILGPRRWPEYYRRLCTALDQSVPKTAGMRRRELAAVGAAEDALVAEIAVDVLDRLGPAVVSALAPVVVAPRATFLSEYVFSKPDNMFFSLRSLQLEARPSINAVWAKDLGPELTYVDVKGKERVTPVDQWFFSQPEHRVVDGFTYWPGRDKVFWDEQGQVMLANRYRPALLSDPGRRIQTSEVRPWLDLAKHVLRAEGGRNLVRWLDWAGAVVAEAELKPGWMVVVQGRQGIGKGLLIRPIIEGVGRDNTATISGEMLASEFTEYAEKRLVIINELRQTSRGSASGHDQYATLKRLVDPSAETVPINRKYGKIYTARNTSAVFIATNELDGVALDADDRRAFVFVSDAVKWPASRYGSLVGWMDKLGGAELVAVWLAQRWARLSPARRAAVQGNAPWTAGREAMIGAVGGPVLSWVRDHIEADPTPDWPTIISAGQVVANVTRALVNPASGLPRHLRAPTVDQVGRWLAGLGAARLAEGQPIRTKTKGQARFWAIRDATRFASLGPGAVRKLIDENSADNFNGSQVVNGEFGGGEKAPEGEEAPGEANTVASPNPLKDKE